MLRMTKRRRRLHALETLETRTVLNASLGSLAGVNVSAIGPADSAETWVDAAKDLAPWGTVANPFSPSTTIPLNATGYPLADAATYTALTAYPDGVYTLSFTGKATLNVSGMASVIGTPVVQNGVTTAMVQVTHQPTRNVILKFTGTDPTNPVGNLHLFEPGYNAGSTQVFSTDFLNRISIFDDLRYLNWENIQAAPGNWSQRVTSGDFYGSEAGATSYEDMIALANATGAGVWINVPDQATDAYIQSLAQLLHSTLNPSAAVHIEYGNELWSLTNPASARVLATAKANPAVTATIDQYRVADQAAIRLSQISTIFRQVYGDRPGMVLPIAGGQAANPGYLGEELSYMAAHIGAPSQVISGVAINAYATILGAQEAGGWTPDQIFAYLNNYINTNLNTQFTATDAVAQQYGVPMLAYEGGQALRNFNGALNSIINAAAKSYAEYDPRMAQVIQHLVNAWQADGGQDFNFFAFVEPPGNYGSWGQLDAINLPGSVKWDTVVGLIKPSGDINLDGTVNFADFQALQSQFLAGRWWQQGDFLHSGLTDWADALALESLLTNLTPAQQATIAAFNASVHAFDFGPSASPTPAGWTPASDLTSYSPAQGYGWLPGSVVTSQDFSAGPNSSATDVNQDVVDTPNGTFAVDLPNGSYRVGVRLGDPGAVGHDLMGVYVQGVLVDTLTTNPGQSLSISYPARVTNGQLDVQFRDLGGNDPNVAISALMVSPSSTTTAADKPETIASGGPYVLGPGGSVKLNATGVDPQGYALSIDWDINGDGVPGDIYGATPTLTYASLVGLGITTPSGTIPITVRANDGHGHIVTSTTTLTIQPVLGSNAGINLAPIYPNESAQTWVDAANDFGAWGPADPNAPPATIPINANGYPLTDAGTIAYLNGYPDGVYTLTYTGTAQLAVTGMAGVIGTPTVQNGVTTAMVQVTHQPGMTAYFSFTGTDPNNPVGNLHFYQPGYGPGTTQVFSNDFLGRMSIFGDIRFMKWEDIETPQVNWSQRVTPASFLGSFASPEGTQIPYEDMIALANATNSNLWINIPDQAGNDYVQQLANLLHATLKPNLTIRIEYGNEVWDSGQAAYARVLATAQANPAVTATTPTLQVADQVAIRLSQIATIFRQTFSDRVGEVAPILAGWTANPAYLTEALGYMAAHIGAPNQIVSGIAIGAYATVLPGTETVGMTPTQIFSALNSYISTSLDGQFASHQTLAATYGLPMLAYEGGQALRPLNGLTNTVLNADAQAAAQVDPRMGGILQAIVADWQKHGGQVFNFFDYAEGPSIYGNFGLLNSDAQAGTVKWDTVVGMIRPVGDVNLDGTVNFADFQAFQTQFLAGRWWQQGDFDGSGLADWSDALTLEQALTGLTPAQQASVAAYNASVKAFDFGPATSPLAASWTRASDQSIYGPATGFGWLPGSVVTSQDFGGTAPNRDVVDTANGTFAVDLPNGSYRVAVRLGDRGTVGHDLMGVFLQGVLVDTITTAPGQILTLSYPVQVTNGQLDVNFQDLGGSDPVVAVAGLMVAPSANTTPADQAETFAAGGPYTIGAFGTLNFAAAATDPQGYPLNVTWDINGDGNFADVYGATGPLAYSQLQKLGINVLTAGTINIIAKADDGHGHVLTSSTTLTVTPPSPGTTVSYAPTAPEGSPAYGSGFFVDPNAGATSTVTVDYGDGTGPQPVTLRSDDSFPLVHTYGEFGTYTVTVSGTDNLGYVSAQTSQIVVTNVAPTLPTTNLNTQPATLKEGSVTTVNGTFKDPGTLDTHTVSIAWGDGQTSSVSVAAGILTFTSSHVYLDNGAYPIGLTVYDNGGGVSPLATIVANVQNVAPTPTKVTLNQGQLGSGAPATISGLFTDPGALDAHTASIAWGDGNAGTQALAAGVLAFGPISETMGASVSPVVLTLTDKDGGTSSVPVPLVTALSLSQASLVEGGGTTLTGSFSASGAAGAETVVVSWGDGTTTSIPLAAGVATFSASHTFADNVGPTGQGVVSVAVTNTLGATAVAGTPVTVLNVAPSFPASGGPTLGASTVVEGSNLSLSGAFLDPGTADTHTVTINWGDGSAPQVLNLAAGVTTLPKTMHRFLEYQAAPAAVRVVVADKDNASAEADFSVTIQGVAPTAMFVAPPLHVARNQAVTFGLSASSLSPTAAAAGFSYVVNWGDGTTQSFPQTPGVLATSHVYPTAALYTVTLQAQDRDGFLSAPVTAKVSVVIIDVQPDPSNPSQSMLVVGGTAANDTILVAPGTVAGTLNVTINGSLYANRAPAAGTVFTKLYALGGLGNDSIRVDPAVTIAAVLDGGAGNDTLTAGSAPAVLLGGDGNDTLTAGAGRDLLIGDAGSDTLLGGAGDDILIAGTTSFDASLPGLLSLLSEWSRTDLAGAARIADLNGSTPGGLNGANVLTATTTVNDAAIDQLSGGAGLDWFLADLNPADPNQDVLTNAKPTDVQTSIS